MNDNEVGVDISPWMRTREIVCWVRWEVEIVRLAHPHTPFNPLSEREVSGAKRFCDDYEIIPFSHSPHKHGSRDWRKKIGNDMQNGSRCNQKKYRKGLKQL